MGDWSNDVARAVHQIMGDRRPPTAIFCSCDAVARLAYRTLSTMGLSVPADVSVVGFDDDPLAEWLSPGLTTVRQPFHDMGEAAIELLCNRMDDPHSPVEHRVLPVQVIRRGSVAAPKSL